MLELYTFAAKGGRQSCGKLQQHVRARAFKAYAAALKRGHKPEAILAAVKPCAGVNKPGTEFVPMLSTWLNEERWKNAADTTGMSSEEFAARYARLAAEARQRTEDFNREIRRQTNERLGIPE
ncbi:hypothetical protein [Bradyrhizobium sp. STM 3557]|uniref:hypothetical protein n=1 Tax=Bradyrhizobium sp. STM 3557 TaxID=578920 RepID=UPI00388D219E